MNEQTLSIIKPDAVERNLEKEIKNLKTILIIFFGIPIIIIILGS